ncbi:hypothetical protein [Synechococcus sp. BIOS-E4-1]|nr:hypothetical protein [Synechococcus sp. BIOS-E4-1]
MVSFSCQRRASAVQSSLAVFTTEAAQVPVAKAISLTSIHAV